VPGSDTFVPLHVFSHWSLGYGVASVPELVERAAALELDTLALTDRESLAGQLRFQKACQARGIRPLAGVELDCPEGRLVLLARDAEGYGSLCQLVSALVSDDDDPVNLPALVASHRGLFALGDRPAVVRALRDLDVSPEDLGLLLVRPTADPRRERSLLDASRELDVPLVADLDALLLSPEDHELHALQLAVHAGETLPSVLEGARRQAARLLRPAREVDELFRDLPQALAATARIAERCDFDLTACEPTLPAPPLPPKQDADEVLRARCEAALGGAGLGGSHRARLEHELTVLRDCGLSGFMLLVGAVVDHCREAGIEIVCRGSAVGSLVTFLLGASPVDPLRHRLLFERFLHREKTEPPDIDLDLPSHRRDEVVAWVLDRLGQGRAAALGAFQRFQRRSALREGLKACGIEPDAIEQVLAGLPPDELDLEVDFLSLGASADGATPRPAIPPSPSTAAASHAPAPAPSLTRALALSERLVNRPRLLAAHPGGVVFTAGAVERTLPLGRAPRGVVSQYDAETIAQLGLVKIDLLGNRCLSELAETSLLVGSEVVAAEDDPETLQLIDEARTVGLFQLESPAMRSLLARLPIRAVEDVVAALALVRPAAAGARARGEYIRRTRGETGPQLEPRLAALLAPTHGVLLYEEDIMALLAELGGLDLTRADRWRELVVKADEEDLASLEQEIVPRAAKRGIAEPSARAAWASIKAFAAYSFSRAHATSYGFLAHRAAYARAHHPVEFGCALLNHHEGLYPDRVLATDLRRSGVELLPPHVNTSELRFSVERDADGRAAAIRVGLGRVRGLPRRTALRLIERRPFASLQDLVDRTKLSTRQLEPLIRCGACDGLPPLYAGDYPFVHDAVIEALQNDADIPGQVTVSPGGADPGQLALYARLSRVQNELNLLGLPVSEHPMAVLRREARRNGCVSLSEAAQVGGDEVIQVAATVAAMRRVETRGGVMQFVTLEDETGMMEAVVDPATFRRLGDRIATPGPFIVSGQVCTSHGLCHVSVEEIAPFFERRRMYS
jgi:DNA-directed DNA polymerase III PolC